MKTLVSLAAQVICCVLLSLATPLWGQLPEHMVAVEKPEKNNNINGSPESNPLPTDADVGKLDDHAVVFQFDQVPRPRKPSSSIYATNTMIFYVFGHNFPPGEYEFEASDIAVHMAFLRYGHSGSLIGPRENRYTRAIQRVGNYGGARDDDLAADAISFTYEVPDPAPGDLKYFAVAIRQTTPVVSSFTVTVTRVSGPFVPPPGPFLAILPNALDFGDSRVGGMPSTLPLTVRGGELTADITIAGVGDGFSVSPETIPVGDVMSASGTEVVVQYDPSGVNVPSVVSSTLTFESGAVSQSLSLRAHVLPRPVIVSSTDTLDFGPVVLGSSVSTGLVFNVRGEYLAGDVFLSVAGAAGFLLIPERISQALASREGYEQTVLYDVSEASGVSDLEGTLTLSSPGANDVSVILRVSVVKSEPEPDPDPDPDPDPNPDPDPEPNPDPDPEPEPEPQMQFPFSVSDAGGAVLFPNPVGSILHIGRSESRERRAVVYTLRGRPVLRVTLDDWSSGLDVTALVPGAYVIKIETDIMSRYFVKK